VDDRALYVYGVVPSNVGEGIFRDVRGVDPTEHVLLVDDDGVAAVASPVRLEEFGEEAIQENLRDPGWLAEKARAHDGVLAAAVGRTTVLPFRFGAIYRDEQHVIDLLRERTDFSSTLSRLEGALELGLKAYVDVAVVEERLAAAGAPGERLSAGRAYLQRKQLARELEAAVDRFAAERAQVAHERLQALAREARVNPVRRADESDSARRMILNGAYLVDATVEQRFRDEVEALAGTDADAGVAYEATGPWPPYNFVEGESGP
jgi:hypothetical protein